MVSFTVMTALLFVITEMKTPIAWSIGAVVEGTAPMAQLSKQCERNFGTTTACFTVRMVLPTWLILGTAESKRAIGMGANLPLMSRWITTFPLMNLRQYCYYMRSPIRSHVQTSTTIA
jgi:thymidine phosphorylase